MKTIFLLLSVVLLCGCASVRVKVQDGDWQMSAISLFKGIQVPEVYIGSDGSIIVTGYNSSVDMDAMGSMIGAAVRAAVTM